MLDGYIDVAERLQKLKETYPEATLQPLDPSRPYFIEQIDGKTYVVYVAACYRDPHDARPGVGVAWEIVPGKGLTNGSELMIAETSAWGRAIVATMQTATKRIASKQEITAAKTRQAWSVESSEATFEGVATAAQVIADVKERIGAVEMPEAPTCKHGHRIERSGTSSKTNREYLGYACPEKVKARQCMPDVIWYKQIAGKWVNPDNVQASADKQRNLITEMLQGES
jgi:hypothetical protein